MGVKKVTVFQDSLGRYHENEREAAMAEAELKITQFFGSNHIDPRQVKAITQNAEGIIRALEPIVSAEAEMPGDEK